MIHWSKWDLYFCLRVCVKVEYQDYISSCTKATPGWFKYMENFYQRMESTVGLPDIGNVIAKGLSSCRENQTPNFKIFIVEPNLKDMVALQSIFGWKHVCCMANTQIMGNLLNLIFLQKSIKEVMSLIG